MPLATSILTILTIICLIVCFLFGAWTIKRGEGYIKHLVLLAIILCTIAIVGFYANLPNLIYKVQTAPISLTAPNGLDDVELKLQE